MAWKTIDRQTSQTDLSGPPVLSQAVRRKIAWLQQRYETKRAALLPALHIVQAARGHVCDKAMAELAELCEIAPADVLDVVTFYSHFWQKPRGRRMVVVCKSITCSLCGGGAILEAVKRHLGIDEFETTADGEYSLMTEQCLGACEVAPCMLINEVMHGPLSPEDVPRILDDPNNATLDVPRSDLYDAPTDAGADA